MKRKISLILVVALLASLLVLPVSAETTAGLKMSVVRFTEDRDRAEIIEGAEASTIEPGNLIAVKLDYVNDATPRWVTAYGTKILFNSAALELYSFKGGKTGKTTVGPQVGGLDGAIVSNASADSIMISEGIAYGIEVSENETIPLAWVLFRVLDDADSGDISFSIDQTFEHNLSGSLTENGNVAEFDGINFLDTKEVTVVNGVAPTIDSVSIESTEAVYGANGEYALTATSTKGGNITTSVNWSVEPADKGVSIDGTSLKVTETAPVGEYTVTASAKDGESRGESVSTVFTIKKAQINSVNVTVSGFDKGLAISSASAATNTNAVDVDILGWYEGEGTETAVSYEKFQADKTYTVQLKLTLKDSSNYELAEGATAVIQMTNTEQSTSTIIDGIAVASATTAKKTKLVVNIAPVSMVEYDTKLNEITNLEGFREGVVFVEGTREPVEGRFEWDLTDEELNATVGEVTVGDKDYPNGRSFKAKFIPENHDIYETLSLNAYVIVTKRVIHIDDIQSWNYTNPIEYNGKEHTVELVIPSDQNNRNDLLKIDYDGNTATAVGTYTATATIKPLDEAHYSIYDLNVERKLENWEIKKGTLTDYEPTYTKEVTFGAAQQFDITPDLFGLPAYDVEHFNVQDPSSTIESDPLLTNRTILSNGGITYELRATTIEDVNNKVTSERTLTYLYDNYEAFTVKLIIKVIAKTTNSDTLKITVPNEVAYGTTVTPTVGDTKPADADEVNFKFFDKDGKQVTDQPFPVGEYKVTAICEDSSTIYTAEESFEVVPYELKDENVTLGSDLAYTRSEQTQTVTVTVDGKTLTVGTDYTVTGLTGTEPGTYTVTVTGTGNYNGTGKKNFNIEKADIATADISDIEGPFGYTGIAWEPTVTVKFNGTALTLGTDYTVSYKDNVNVGTATVTITGTGDHFKGTATKTFEITAASINGFTVSTVATVTYNTKAQTPAVTVASSGRILTADDYDVAYTNNVNAGTATVTVTGKGNFTGTASKDFTIDRARLDVNNLSVTHYISETAEQTYPVPSNMFLDGEPNTVFSIEVSGYAGNDIFAANHAPVADGTNVKYQLNGTKGSALVEIKVTPDSKNYYGGSFTLTFVVNDKENVSNSISFPNGSAVYTGKGIKYENAAITGHSNALLRYGYTANESTGATLDASGLPLTVGTYTVSVTYSDDTSYGYKNATFTITKATPTGTPGYTLIEESGKTLADAKLTVGTIRPAGTIAWELPASTALVDGKAYAWTFTPNDTHNYTILIGTLIPYIDDGMDYIPGVIDGNTGSFTFHDVSRYDYYYNAVKWAAENGIASGTSRYTFSPNAVCTRAQTLTFLWRAAGSPLPRYRVCPFTDVKPTDYYYNAVLWAVEQGITTGLNATTFGPDVTVDRGQVATFLYRVASASAPATFNPFTDVKSTAYNYNAILWAYDNRITTGTSDTTFSPDAYCTRAQIVTFLYRYYQGR